MPIDVIVVAALPLQLTISGHPVHLSVAWEDESRSYPVGIVTAHFTGRSGQRRGHRLGDCCRNPDPDCDVISVSAEPVAQRIAAALLEQGIARPQKPPPPAPGTIGLYR